jgi:hypothetical protein
VSVRITLLGPGGRVRAVCELGTGGGAQHATGPDAAAATRLADDLARPRPDRRRAVCVAAPTIRPGRIII